MIKRLQIVEQKLQHIPREKEGLRLWLRIVSCSQMVEQEVRSMLRDKYDSTLPRFELLSALDRVPDGLSMGELSGWLMVTKGNVTGIAERLSEDGFIKRNPTPTDRRSFCVTLTPKGKKIYKEMEEDYESLLDKLFTDVSLDDSDTFTGVLAKVKEVVEELREDRE
ncbi:MAG: MarR family transcriptional regulator [Gammaproteobacteria bacterium]|jgi:DNA-binding MarR family transcriptional regulator|nr:MarR family transcriptional regulator [Gammaproteobacteria bacterium]